MYERILVPLDGSSLARQVLPYARMVAEAKGADVELVEVIAPLEEFAKLEVSDSVAAGVGSRPDPWAAPDEWTLVEEHLRNNARKQLGEAATLLGRETYARCTVLEGEPAEAIIKEADKLPGTLIAMATHGRSGIGRWLLGSVTDSVIRHAEHPTLVIRAQEGGASAAPSLNEVVLPLDGSATAEAAIPYAVEMAKVLGVGVALVRAITPMAYADSYSETVPDAYDALLEQAQADAGDYLKGIARRVFSRGVPDVTSHVMVGNAASVILGRADEGGDKLVVMATHGRSGVRRAVLGSVADRVIRHSAGPVLVVRPREAA